MIVRVKGRSRWIPHDRPETKKAPAWTGAFKCDVLAADAIPQSVAD